MSKVIIIGASRGLGAELVKLIKGSNELLTVSRTPIVETKALTHFCCDMSNELDQSQLLRRTLEFTPDKIFYVAGGGPYGDFQSKSWKDHKWGLEVSFIAPARLINEIMRSPELKNTQIVLLGSAIAESSGDMKAASYAAAKHALKGLYSSIHLESPNFDLRLFSPGYMDTEMLPKNSTVRDNHEILSPIKVAEKLWDWSCDKTQSGSHLTIMSL